MKFNTCALSLAVFLSLGSSCRGFMQQSTHIANQKRVASSTELYIIGPMLRKMREENAKKKMPMASEDERMGEAPGLRVGSNAWKWPPVWPYSVEDFTPKDDIKAPDTDMSPMASMMSGSLPTAEGVKDIEEEESKLDVMQYWGDEKSSIKTEIDAEAIESLKSHYGFYLKDGMSVLEFGAAEDSYLPDGLNLSRHVGVGASKALMDENPTLTEKITLDLNNVVAERGIDSDELRALGAGQFDAIVMANTIDFLTNPREVFRSAWALLKPGGLMMVPFTNRDAYNSKFERAQTKMWRDMTDDQHMWICGSFFQFSASDGWENLNGFDISPEGAKKEEGIAGMLSNNNAMNMYVVQANKAVQADEIDNEDPEKSFRSQMWLLPTLEERDKQLLSARLARAYQITNEDMSSGVQSLPKIYESLIKMDQFAFTFSMQAQLATDLVSDPNFNGNDDQIAAMKMGLGLRTPSEDFWLPIGQRTAAMNPEDKVNLLAHIIPCFGSNNPEQEAALEAFVAGLEPTFALIRSKYPSMSESDVQLAGTELLAAEILKPGRSTKKEFAMWVSAMTEDEITEIVSKRKSFKQVADTDMKDMQEKREAEEKRIEGLREKMVEQQQKAREERSMVFNTQTGKMEEIKK